MGIYKMRMFEHKLNIDNQVKFKKYRKKFNKVFGIGMSKTATTSLAEALHRLGIKVMDYSLGTEDGKSMMKEIMYPSTDYALTILEENKYDGLTDIVPAVYYQEMDRKYLNSKFILTTRDLSDWLSSSRRFWKLYGDNKARLSARSGFINTVLYGTWRYNKSRFRYVYKRHNLEVVKYFKKKYGNDINKHLLVMDIFVGDGYDKLCKFLGYPVIQENFPHKNHNKKVKK